MTDFHTVKAKNNINETKTNSYRAINTLSLSLSVIKKNQLTLYRELNDVYSEIDKIQRNSFIGQNVVF